MEPELAAMIVERYRAVLADTQDIIAGAPESKLPCDQSLIKEAIRYTLAGIEKHDEAYIELQEAYSKLGLFVTDEEAEIVRLGEQAVVTMDPALVQYLAKHGKIQQRIQSQMFLLTEELNEFIATQTGD